MKKLLLLPMLLLASLSIKAQNVGIGTLSPTEQLHTTGTVRFQNYSGAGDRFLQIDSSGVLKVTNNQPIFRSDAANSNKLIPDNQCPNMATAIAAVSAIPVNGVTNDGTLAVKLNITHSYIEDLKIFLVAPNGNTICLTDGMGGSGDNYTNTIFADNGASLTTGTGAPFSGVYAPIGIAPYCVSGSTTYTNFNSYPYTPNGTWTLYVYDKAAGDIGTLDNWEITFGGAQAFSQQTNIAGNISLQLTGAKKGRVLTATDGMGHADWEDPVQYNTGFSTNLPATTTLLSSASLNQVLPFETGSISTSNQFDDGNNFSNTFNHYKVPADGVYQFNAYLGISNIYNATATGIVVVRVLANGVIIASKYIQATASSPLPSTFEISVIRRLHTGDLITIAIFNNTGTALTFSNSSCNFSGVRIY